MSGGPSNIPIQLGECFKATQNFQINIFGGKKEISNGDIFKCFNHHIDEKFPGIYASKYENGDQYAFGKETFNMIEKVACPTEIHTNTYVNPVAKVFNNLGVGPYSKKGGRRRKTRRSHKRKRYSRRR